MFNDEWMRKKGFLEKTGMTARDLVASGLSGELLSIESSEPVEAAVRLMGEHDFSQISITQRPASGGIAERDPPLRGAGQGSAGQVAAGRDDHAAGVPFVDISTPVDAAVDDDHAAEPGGAGARFQDRQDVHHHPVGHHSSAVLIAATPDECLTSFPRLSQFIDCPCPSGRPSSRRWKPGRKSTTSRSSGRACGYACYQVAQHDRRRRVFELGSGYGYSTAFFARALKENGGGVSTTSSGIRTSRPARASTWPRSARRRVTYHNGEAVERFEAALTDPST